MEGTDISSCVEAISRELDEKQLLTAKADYQKLTGPIFQDDKSYEHRMGLFLEWYILNYSLPGTGQIPLKEYLDSKRSQLDSLTLSHLESMPQSLHGIFQVTQLSTSHIRVCELFEDKEFRVNQSQGNLFFNKNDLFEGHLFSLENNNVFTGNFVYHPSAVYKFIRAQVKAIKAVEKEIANTFKIRQKEVKGIQKKLENSKRLIDKTADKIKKAKKPEKREKLEQEFKENEREQNQIIADLKQAEVMVEQFASGEMGIELKARRFKLMQGLSCMSLKWERSRQIDIKDIYKN